MAFHGEILLSGHSCARKMSFASGSVPDRPHARAAEADPLAGFCTKGPRRAFRLRKISGGVNTALDDARQLVREILGEEA